MKLVPDLSLHDVAKVEYSQHTSDTHRWIELTVYDAAGKKVFEITAWGVAASTPLVITEVLDG